MNPLASRLHLMIEQETQNVKFNLLINSNTHNQNTDSQPSKSKLRLNSNQQKETFLKPMQTKQINLQMKIDKNLTQLKKRSFSQKKILTHHNSNDKKWQTNQTTTHRKRLNSAHSQSKIQQLSLQHDLLIKKQQFSSKQQLKQMKTYQKGIKSQSKAQGLSQNKKPSNLLSYVQSSASNIQSLVSGSKLKLFTQVPSQRITSFAISDSQTQKNVIKTKLFGFQNNNIDTQIKFNTQAKSTSNRELVSYPNLKKQLDNNLLLFFNQGRLNEYTSDYKSFRQILKKEAQKSIFIHQNLQKHFQKVKIFALRYKTSGSMSALKMLQFKQKKVISNFQFLQLFQNWKDILNESKYKQNQIKGVSFYYPDQNKGRKLAAKKIINFLKQIKEKNINKKMSSLIKKIKKIQNYWRRALLIKKNRKIMLENAQRKINQFSVIQKKFFQSYNTIKTSRKIQVHIGSLCFEQFKRVSLENKELFENILLSRIFKALQSPDTFIIYVLPVQLSESVVKYYQRLFKIASGSDLTLKERVYLIYPENTDRLNKICELTTLNNLLYSPKALKRIKFLIKNISSTDNAYIVPSYPSIQYVRLSHQLHIPIFSSSLQLSKLYSTKIGYRQIIDPILQKEKSNPPFGLLKSISSVFSEKQLINTLALLIYKNQDVKRWYFKIDDQFNSRGLAYFNVNSIQILSKINDERNQDVFGDLVSDEKQIIKIIANQLKQKLKQRLKIVNKNIYPTYHQFITHFLTRGGVIEASPSKQTENLSICFVIQPNGDFEIIGTLNKLALNSKYICQSALYPAKNSKSIDIQKIVRHLYRRLYIKMKFFGHFTVDLLVENVNQQKPLPYIIGLSCFMTLHASALFMFKQMTKTAYQKDTNIFRKNKPFSIQNEGFELSSSKISKIEFQQSQEQQQSVKTTNLMTKISQTQKKEKNTQSSQKSISFLYCPKIMLPDLEGISQFFRKCKFQNIAFDVQRLLGTLFLPLHELEYENIGFLICQETQNKFITETIKVIQFLSKNYRRKVNLKSKNILKKQIDEVGLLRGVILSDIHKSKQYKKAQQDQLMRKNCQTTLNNLQFS